MLRGEADGGSVRPYVPTAAAAALAALALAGLAVLARPGAGPDAPPPPRETAPAAADATAAPDPAAAARDCLGGAAVASPDANPGLVADCSALLRARDALRGSAPLDWSADRPIANWDGVAVGGDPPRVTGLDLRGRGLAGTIPPELGRLTGLTSLRLGGNRLTGRIPPELGRLSRLRILDLHGNRLTGGVPGRQGATADLMILDLRDNRLTGDIPRSLDRLLGLYEIRLSGNALTGCVPSALEGVRGDAADLGLPWCSPPRPEARSAVDVLLGLRSGLDLIVPAPGAFAHRVFGDGEAIDWPHGIFVLDVETGLTEGYAVAGLDSEDGYTRYTPHRGGWIETGVRDNVDGYWHLLLDRETGRSWRWPDRVIELKATSEEHLLFFAERSGGEDESRSPGYLRAAGREAGEPAGRLIVTSRLMEEVARFSMDPDDWSYAAFAPDGRTVALATADKFYLVSVATGASVLLSAPPPRHGEHPEFSLEGASFRSRQLPPLEPTWTWKRYEGGRGIVVIADYGMPATKEEDGILRSIIRERRYFGWDGEELPAPACPGTVSPDGRYAAVLDGAPHHIHHYGYQLLENPWPSVVFTDAETCAPIFRVRSARTYGSSWQAGWLPTSEGFVVSVRGGGVRYGYAIARVAPEPALTPLPDEWPGPDPAPTGGGRYFGYSSRVYDAAGDRWYGPEDAGGPFWWGASHRERWFHSESSDWGSGANAWLLLPPKIEFPPFSEEIAFRVARTGSCLRLREEPGEDGRVLGCLPDGERLLFAERDAEVPESDALRRAFLSPFMSPHSSLSLLEQVWVHVRTADGAEGWVSHDYLDHD